jgi:uncharacterized protein YPO0396
MKEFMDPKKQTEDDVDELMKQLNIILSELEEAESKHQKSKAEVKVVQFDEVKLKLEKQVADLTRQMEEMRQTQQAATSSKPATRRRWGGRCKDCREKKLEDCKHCFSCGGDDGHFARNCHKSENLRGLRK